MTGDTERPFRVIVTGARDWNPVGIARLIVESLYQKHKHLTIIQGEASGVDSTFKAVAREYDIAIVGYPADWDAYKKAAGPIRNKRMVDSGADLCIAVHYNLDSSKGTKGCVALARASGIPVVIIKSMDDAMRFQA